MLFGETLAVNHTEYNTKTLCGRNEFTTEAGTTQSIQRRAGGQASIPSRGKSFSLFHSVQTDPGAHPAPPSSEYWG
jgi:hypothetical protein